jgi:hypothetical protein
MVYSRKSPFEFLFFKGGEQTGHCRGADALTTRPQDAVDVVAGRGAALRWDKYIHATSVVMIDSVVALSVIMDPVRKSHTLSLVSRDCRLLSRTHLRAPVTIVDMVATRVAAVSNGEYPDVIVYSLTTSAVRRP